MRLELLRSLLSTRWSYYTRQRVGVVANGFASEADRASTAYLSGATIIARCIEAAICMAVALAVAWQATVGSLVVGGFVMVAVSGFVRMTRRAGVKQTKLLHSLLGNLTDSLQAV